MAGTETRSSSGKHLEKLFCCIYQPLVSGVQCMQEEMEVGTLSNLFLLKFKTKWQAFWAASRYLNSYTEKFLFMIFLLMYIIFFM